MSITHASSSQSMGVIKDIHHFLCMSVYVCPCSKRKSARAINTKVSTHVLHGRPLDCIDLRSKIKDHTVISCAAIMGMHVNSAV